MRAASRKAIPCLRTLVAFFAGSQVNRTPGLYEMYLRMSRCKVLRRDRVSGPSRSYGAARTSPSCDHDRSVGCGVRWAGGPVVPLFVFPAISLLAYLAGKIFSLPAASGKSL